MKGAHNFGLVCVPELLFDNNQSFEELLWVRCNYLYIQFIIQGRENGQRKKKKKNKKSHFLFSARTTDFYTVTSAHAAFFSSDLTNINRKLVSLYETTRTICDFGFDYFYINVS